MKAAQVPVAKMVGEAFGKLVVIEIVKDGAKKKARVRCACGRQKLVATGDLRSEKVKSCGKPPCRVAPDLWTPVVAPARPAKLRINLQRPADDQQRLFRLFSRVKRMPSGCWEFQGSRHPWGHGYFQWSVDEGVSYAHRASWRLLRGPIPPGLGALHHCDNPPCVRPDHLHLGTEQDNSDDMVSRRRHQHGERHSHAKLTEAQVVEIRERRAQGEGPVALGLAFGIDASAIVAICSGTNWKYAGGPLTAPRQMKRRDAANNDPDFVRSA